jgi:hypothetical protein
MTIREAKKDVNYWQAESNEECINALNKALKFAKTGEYIK